MIVVDASVLVVALVDGVHGAAARTRLRPERVAAPELVDLEVVSVLRRQTQSGTLPLWRADHAIADLVELPIERWPHRALLRRCWELRENLTAYDAAYVALAEVLGALLVTGDARLACAPERRCDVETFAPLVHS